MSTINNIYTTRQAASIGLQPGNLIGETTYVTETQITPPIKQRIRNTKLLSTNISRCQCCCPPYASGLCRSCLCPCWAYLLIGLLFALLLAGLAVEIGFLTREKIRNRSVSCTNYVNATYLVSPLPDNSTSVSLSSLVTNNPCRPDGTILNSSTSVWTSFTYLCFIVHGLTYLIQQSMN